ncbi:hypothetical protein [Arthrobacter sp. MA-N2]|uniref:hypothetical protein n=1 Tax=Arthrobacter sp. MA-N2 TaxID=1101188 RepID=UPI0012DE03CD|nr:hypothetical protein [Arthrobacter sp. MA-N2]
MVAQAVGLGIVAPREVAAAMPYIDINPHRQRPKWISHVGLGVLAVLAVVVVVVALAGT